MSQAAIATPAPAQPGATNVRDLTLHLWVFAIVFATEAIGNISFSIGVGKLVLFPMLYALLVGGVISIASSRIPSAVRVDEPLQYRASAMVTISVLLLTAKLALLVGGSIPRLLHSGWALTFQELGHFFGTVLFALPIALLLGVKREAVGATFSIGREPSLAIISEKYGLGSPEGRGVLAEYVTGTVIGAIFIALLASTVSSLGIFHPIALAMGAGVGSASMMAAAAGAIAAGQPSEVAKDVAAFAAASNLVTTSIGTYVTLFVSLPFANMVYRRLEPLISPKRTRGKISVEATDLAPVPQASVSVDLTWTLKLTVTFVAAAATLVGGNWITYHTLPQSALVGMLAIVVVALIGNVLARLIPVKIPIVCWVSLVGMLATAPLGPWAAPIAAVTAKVNFMALTTPILAYAGLSIAKDLPAFRRLGWRIVVTSLTANAGTFLFAAAIAQFLMGK
jgi:hypothetical protein